MSTNGAGQGLLAEDWARPPVAPIHRIVASDAAEPPPASADAGELSARTSHGLILPDGVALMLDTALHGDRAPSGTPGSDGRPRSKNLTVLVGTVRVVTTGRGQGRRIFTELGAAEYRYELSINEVVGDEQSAARTSYRLPISMSDAVRARAEHLLVDGQRIALLGPLGMEDFYDQRFQRDAYDAGRRTWDIRIDVLGVQEIGDDVPDMAWVQLEGEVVDRPRVYTRQYGDRRTLVEHYAGITLRYREVLAGSFGRAVRPVVKSVPVEVLISADEEIIAGSDALLRPGNRVRVEGRLSPSTFRLPRAALEDATVQTALIRTRARLETRNADLTQPAEASSQPAHDSAQRQRRQGQRAAARQQPLSAEDLERQIARAQQRLLTGRRVRVEVGYIELLSGEAAAGDERARLIAEAGERRRTPPARRSPERALNRNALRSAQDHDTVQAMQEPAEDSAPRADVPDDGGDEAPPPAELVRPRRARVRASGAEDEPVAL